MEMGRDLERKKANKYDEHDQTFSNNIAKTKRQDNKIYKIYKINLDFVSNDTPLRKKGKTKSIHESK